MPRSTRTCICRSRKIRGTDCCTTETCRYFWVRVLARTPEERRPELYAVLDAAPRL